MDTMQIQLQLQQINVIVRNTLDLFAPSFGVPTPMGNSDIHTQDFFSLWLPAESMVYPSS
jgi:hypothetical protein